MSKFKRSIAFVVAIIVLLLLSAWAKDQLPRTSEQMPKTAIRAVYLVDEGRSMLDQRELERHPEVIVTGSFKELKEYAKQPVAIWIDKNWAKNWEETFHKAMESKAMEYKAAGDKEVVKKLKKFMEEEAIPVWLQKLPQANYPLVVVGYGNKQTAFEMPSLAIGVSLDERPGFSVKQRKRPNNSVSPETIFEEGYVTDKPHVEDILRITNGLLDGTLKLAPEPTLLPVTMPAAPTLPN
jgi:hypothetical protein